MARSNVTFYLGYAPAGAGLTSRRLIVTEHPGAGDDTIPLTPFYDQTLAGTTEFVTTPITENKFWQAVLIDTKTSGEVRARQVLGFSTGYNVFPGPKSDSDFQVYAIEDLSSSSESSINSSSSSSSLSSSSSSSLSSSSSSSVSSSSTSSSLNSSSSSPSSDNSSSSSVSSSSSSSVSSSSVSSINSSSSSLSSSSLSTSSSSSSSSSNSSSSSSS